MLGELIVILTEPSSTQQKIIQKYLNNLGVNKIEAVSTGAQALNSMLARKPDLVISSLYLPDMSGTDLLETMRNEQQLSDLPFLLISSETRFRYLDPIRQAGAIAILPKPCGQDELKVALKTTLDHLDPEHLHLDEFDVESVEILIVDDSPIARKFIKRSLENMGLERFTDAENGVEAAKLISERFFDLIVTDYNMPGMDGGELLDYIRKDSPQASVPVLMVTSEEDNQRLAAVQKAGVSAVCDKPFQPETVRKLVHNLLSES
jgi:two-component system, chemotaxis family, chemotaxis protein CheY